MIEITEVFATIIINVFNNLKKRHITQEMETIKITKWTSRADKFFNIL